MKVLTPAERLYVAADSPVSGILACTDMTSRIYDLANKLRGADVGIKIETGARSFGYGLMRYLKQCGRRVFLDTKLSGTRTTLQNDAALLRTYKPEIVTVMSTVSLDALKAFKDGLPDTKVFGVTVLTDFNNDDCKRVFTVPISIAAKVLAERIQEAGLDGIIASALEAPAIRKKFPNLLIATPAVRSAWSTIEDDDQNPERSATPVEAIEAGADYLIVGRQITQAEDQLAATLRTLEEMSVGAAAAHVG